MQKIELLDKTKNMLFKELDNSMINNIQTENEDNC